MLLARLSQCRLARLGQRLVASFTNMVNIKNPLLLNSLLLSVAISYILFGAFVFRALEAANQRRQWHSERDRLSRCVRAHTVAACASHVTDRQAMNTSAARVIDECFGEYMTAATWSVGESVAFSFSVVTVLGFGNTGVHTKIGQLFYLLYAVVGIPLNMLILANVGKFISAAVATAPHRLTKWCRTRTARKYNNKPGLLNSTSFDTTVTLSHMVDPPTPIAATQQPDKQEEEDEDIDEDLNVKPFLFIFTVYMVSGCVFMLIYRTGGDPIVALYETFRSITADFASIMPTRLVYLPLGLLYVTLGLILFTMAIDVASVYLRKLNSVGKKLTNVGAQKIWFNGRWLIGGVKVNTLVEQICDNYDIPPEQRQQVSLKAIVEDSIDAQQKSARKVTSYKPRPPILQQMHDMDDSIWSASSAKSVHLPTLAQAIEQNEKEPSLLFAIPFNSDPMPSGDCLTSPSTCRGLDSQLVEFTGNVRVALIKSEVIEGIPDIEVSTPEPVWPEQPRRPRTFGEAHGQLVNDPTSLHQLYIREWMAQQQARIRAERIASTSDKPSKHKS